MQYQQCQHTAGKGSRGKKDPEELKKLEWADINFKVTASNGFKKIDYKMENFTKWRTSPNNCKL